MAQLDIPFEFTARFGRLPDAVQVRVLLCIIDHFWRNRLVPFTDDVVRQMDSLAVLVETLEGLSHGRES